MRKYAQKEEYSHIKRQRNSLMWVAFLDALKIERQIITSMAPLLF